MKRIVHSLNNNPVSTWLHKVIPYANRSGKMLTLAQQPAIDKHVEILDNRFRGAINFLKSTRITKHNKRFGLQKLPWYLLIGSMGSGKTTLLANSKVNFILEKQFHQNNVKIIPSESCDWWITSDLVLIDVPGKYITSKGKKNTSKLLWPHFLDLAKKKRGKHALNGILISLSLTELVVTEDREQFIHDLKYSLQELRTRFGDHLPFYFIITKCDLLPGFLDFFNDYSYEELTQAWGVTFPASSSPESLIDTFVSRFNALIKRLNTHLIWRLHQERNPYTKFYIKDFPLQLERLKEAIADVIKTLSADIPFYLKGVYLTSATQEAVIDQMGTHPELVPAKEFQQSFQIMHHPNIARHSYFIKQFILHGLIS